MAKPKASSPLDKGYPAQYGRYQLIDVQLIDVVAGHNARRQVGDLDQLITSIQECGILQPLTVAETAGSDRFELIAGERRLAAARQIGLGAVPAIVRNYHAGDVGLQERTIAMLVENLQRSDLDPLEEAAGFKTLVDRGLSQRDVADKVGRSQAHVSKRLALVDLPEAAIPYLAAGNLTLDDAVAVANVDDPELMTLVLKALTEAGKKGWRWDADRELRALQQNLQTERARAATEAKLKAQKVSILKDEPGYGSSSTMALGTGYHCLPMKAAEHAKHPCHAAWIDRWSGEAKYFCTKPANHAETEDKKVASAVRSLTSNRSYSADGADEAKKKAAATRERNKGLRALAPAREAGLQALLIGKPKKEQVLDFVLLQLLQRVIDESGGPAKIAAKWLGIPENRDGYATWSGYLSAGEDAGFSDRLLKLAYAVSLAMGEEPIRMLPERGHFDSAYLVSYQRLLEHLEVRAGYRTEKVERDEAKQANAYRWRPPIEGKPTADKPRPIKGGQQALPVVDNAGIEEGAGEPAPESPESGDAPASPSPDDPREAAAERATASRARRRRVVETDGEPAVSVADGIRRAQAELDAEGPLRSDPEVGDFGEPVVPLDEGKPCPACVKLVNGKCRACGREVRLDYVDGKPVTKAVARSVA